jgi:hypothetical protein
MSESWQEFAKRQSDYAAKMERERDEARRERDQFASMLHDCENERDGLRVKLQEAEFAHDTVHFEWRTGVERTDELKQRLAAVEAERLMWESSCTVAWAAMEKMGKVLAALREPNEAVMKAAVLHYSGDLSDAIRAAVAAAEKEAQP